MKDRLGREFKVGDFVLHTPSGRNSNVNVAIVRSVPQERGQKMKILILNHRHNMIWDGTRGHYIRTGENELVSHKTVCTYAPAWILSNLDDFFPEELIDEALRLRREILEEMI